MMFYWLIYDNHTSKSLRTSTFKSYQSWTYWCLFLLLSNTAMRLNSTWDLKFPKMVNILPYLKAYFLDDYNNNNLWEKRYEYFIIIETVQYRYQNHFLIYISFNSQIRYFTAELMIVQLFYTIQLPYQRYRLIRSSNLFGYRTGTYLLYIGKVVISFA